MAYYYSNSSKYSNISKFSGNQYAMQYALHPVVLISNDHPLFL